VLHRHPAARVIVPPQSTAILSEAGTTPRDEHLRSIEQHGRLDGNADPAMADAAWLKRRCIDTRPSSAGGFTPRLAIPTANAAGTLASLARPLPNRRTEAKIGRNMLNRMTSLGMPVSVRIK
jgi:hypothetical protein